MGWDYRGPSELKGGLEGEVGRKAREETYRHRYGFASLQYECCKRPGDTVGGSPLYPIPMLPSNNPD